MAVENQAPVVPLQRSLNSSRKMLMVREVPDTQKCFPLLFAQLPAERSKVGRDLIDRTHTPLGHGLLLIVYEALNVDHKATHRRPDDLRSATRLRKKVIRKVIGHALELKVELAVCQQKLRPDMLRDKSGRMRHMQHHPGRVRVIHRVPSI
jgi:hypothetical protein